MRPPGPCYRAITAPVRRRDRMPETAPGPFIATEICMTDKNDGLGLSPAEAALREAALDYHRTPTRGKIAVTPTKPLANQRDLSLAYSPGVAYPCLDIEKDPTLAAEYTSRGNLVGVVTNGTAVLGLGDIGPLAAKPVMEARAACSRNSPASTSSTSSSPSAIPTSWSRSSRRWSPRWAA